MDYEPDDLLIFVDDTGDGKRSQPVFGLGGCAVLGADYEVLKAEWKQLRRYIFKLSDDEIFHASCVLSSVSAKQLTSVTDFLNKSQPYKFASIVTQRSIIPDELFSVVAGVNDLVGELCGGLSPCAHWIIEHSDRLCRTLERIGLQTGHTLHYHTPEFDPNQGKPNNYSYYMKKSVKEVGLEMSDLVIFLVGRHYRDQLAGRPSRYLDQISAMFSNRQVGMCYDTVGSWRELFIKDGKIVADPWAQYEIRHGGPPRNGKGGILGTFRFTRRAANGR